MSDAVLLLNSEQSRRQAVKLVLALTDNTPLAPKEYELMLLERFVRGELTIDEMVDLLEHKKQE